MGWAGNHLIEIDERGYGDSDKSVCSFCIGDKYISNHIRQNGSKGKCSFCNKSRNILPVTDIIEIIMKVINRDYMDAEGNIPYDRATGYWEETTDTYDIIHYDLNDYLLIENQDLLNEISDTINLTDKVSVDNYCDLLYEYDISLWKDFCELVSKTSFSAEQIVKSIIEGTFPKDQTDLFLEIKNILDLILIFCEDMHTEEILHSIKCKSKRSIIRIVDYIPNSPIDSIQASRVGTAPTGKASANRMSEQGDMMFYGSDSFDTALKEYRKTALSNSSPNVLTIGSFIPNKRFYILDLSMLSDSKIPSIFDIDKEEERKKAFFLIEFIKAISIKLDSDKDKDTFYRPTQVFTKFIQRSTKYAGIKYKSAQVETGSNYVLFVENQDCINTNVKTNNKRFQLIMSNVEQREDTN